MYNDACIPPVLADKPEAVSLFLRLGTAFLVTHRTNLAPPPAFRECPIAIRGPAWSKSGTRSWAVRARSLEHRLILIVDHDRQVRSSLASRLKAEGIPSKSWADAPELLAAVCAMATIPAAIVLEYRLAAIDGLGLLELLREHPALSAVPVLIFSAINEQKLRDKARRLGAVGWFHKLTQRDEMMATLLRLARGA